MFAVLTYLAAGARAQTTWYVDDSATSGLNNGSSWDDAYVDLQDALAEATTNGAVSEIWVAAGVFTPDQGGGQTPGARSATFQLLNGVALYGGFAGTETQRDQRDPVANVTTLSGDLNGDDGLNFANNGENSYHVVTGSGTGATAVLDGFTITGGNADGLNPHDRGAGMFNDTGHPTVENCAFNANAATDGGGMWNTSSSPTLIDCTFNGNTARGVGGAMHNLVGSPTLINCIFSGNAADGSGGAMENECASSPSLINCVLIGNVANVGGGIFNHNGLGTCGKAGISSDPVIINCLFSGNASVFRAGGVVSFRSTPTLSNCILWGDIPTEIENVDSVTQVRYSDVEGGWPGQDNIASDPTFVAGPFGRWTTDATYDTSTAQTTFVDASAAYDDNELIGKFLNPNVTQSLQSLITANTATTFTVGGDFTSLAGAGVTYKINDYHLLGTSPCIDAGSNTTDPPLPATDLDGNPRVVNGVVDMGAYEGASAASVVVVSSHSVAVPEGQTATFTVTLSTDPQGAVDVTVTRESGDADITVIDPPGGTFALDSVSYASGQQVTLGAAEDVDLLNGTAILSVNAAGFLGAGLVATEQDNDQTSSSVLFVDADAPGQNDGTSWADAFNDLTTALDVAGTSLGISEIRVAQGTYTPAGPGGPRAATFTLISGVRISGGYAGYGEILPDARDIVAYETILSGDLNGDDAPPAGDCYTAHGTPGCSDPVCTASVCALDPVCCAVPWDQFCANEAVVLCGEPDNSFHVVTAESGTDETAILDGFTITGGNADGGGVDRIAGGMVSNNSSPTVLNCTFRGNSAVWFGGGLGAGFEGSPTIVNCTFSDNVAGIEGGGVYNAQDSQATLMNCRFTSNLALGLFPFLGLGGGMFNERNSSATLSNCTFSGNQAQGGGALANDDNGSATLINCVLWGNTATPGFGPQLLISRNSTLSVSYSDIQGGEAGVSVCPLGTTGCTLNWGDGNIHVDPLLTVDGCLQSGSPCIDAGNNDADTDADTPGVQPLPGVDAELNVRRIDDPIAPDCPQPGAACGTPPIVDMGACEFGSTPIPSVLYVDDDAGGADVGTSWADALTDLQTALQTGRFSGGKVGELWVAAGTYTPAPLNGGRAASFRLTAGLGVYGGFAGTETTRAERNPNPAANGTMLSGDLDGDDESGGDNSENSYQVVTAGGVGPTAVLDGFRIGGGNADGESPFDTGAGLYIANGRPTVRNCLIVGNSSATQAGGFHGISARPTFDNLTIDANAAPVGDGGVIVDNLVNLEGVLRLTTGMLNVTSSLFEGPGRIDLAAGTVLKVTGTPGDPPTEIRSNIGGTGNIQIDAGQQLIIGGEATLNLSGLPDDVCNTGDVPGAPPGGTVSVNGALIVQDSATIHNTNIEVNLVAFDGDNDIVHNDIRLLEATLGFGGQFFASGNATISCNNIISEGDRYLDLDPDPDDGEQPTLINNRIIVVIKEGQLSEQGTLLELRAEDYDTGVMNGPNEAGFSGAFPAPGSEGFTPDPSANWVLERLEIKGTPGGECDANLGAKLNLTDRAGFEFHGSGVHETVYVKQLVLHPNTVLNTALQTLYYQELILVGDLGDEILWAGGGPPYPDPFPNCSRIIDIPLLGFSLAVIAMDDPTPPPANEFDIRVRRQVRDPIDENRQPCTCDGVCPGGAPPDPDTCIVGSIERITSDPDPSTNVPIPPGAGGVMDVRTHRLNGPGPASSVAAKGSFARAGNEDVTVTFEYLWIDDGPDPPDDAELVVYLSDSPDVSDCPGGSFEDCHFELATVRPPAPGRAGSIGSGTFAIFRGTFPRGLLNFTRGTYVELKLRGAGGRVWIDNWDPNIQCVGVCGDLNGTTTVDNGDYLLLVAEYGQVIPDFKGCLDSANGDRYIDIGDLLEWDARLTGTRLNLCAITSGARPAASSSMDARFPSLPVANGLLIAGKKSLAGNLEDYLFTVDSNGGCVGKGAQQPASDREDKLGYRANGRLVQDREGIIYQLHATQGLIRLEDGVAVVSGQSHTLPDGIRVTVGVTPDGVGLPITDAAFPPTGFHPADPTIVYVVPVLAQSQDAPCPYRAAARLKLLDDGTYEVEMLYGADPAIVPEEYVPCDGVEPQGIDHQHVREIEVDGHGNVYVLSALEFRVTRNANDWVLIYNEQTGAAADPVLLDIAGPIAMLVSGFDDSLYLASSVDDTPSNTDTHITRFQIDRTGNLATGLSNPSTTTINNDAAIINDPENSDGHLATITSIQVHPDHGTLYVLGFAMPRFDPNGDPNGPDFHPDDGYIHATPTLAIITQQQVGQAAATATASPIDCHDLALPISALVLTSECATTSDADEDGDVDLIDWGAFQRCFTGGSGVPVATGCETFDCKCDGDVDLNDFACYRSRVTGP